MAKRLAMRVEYQKCRNWGHAWDTFNAPRNKKPKIYQSMYQETLRCTRCGTERFRGINFRGKVESPSYDWPEDYKLKKEERPEIAAIRLSLLQYEFASAGVRRRSVAARTKAAKPKKATTKAPAKKNVRHARPKRRVHA